MQYGCAFAHISESVPVRFLSRARLLRGCFLGATRRFRFKISNHKSPIAFLHEPIALPASERLVSARLSCLQGYSLYCARVSNRDEIVFLTYPVPAPTAATTAEISETSILAPYISTQARGSLHSQGCRKQVSDTLCTLLRFLSIGALFGRAFL